MNTPLRLLLIDDHPLLRRGLAELLEASGDYRVVGSVGSGDEGIVLARECQPDMVLLDLHMPGLGGLATLRQLKRGQPQIRVIVLTASDDRDELTAALDEGADGYLLKDSEPESLLAALRAASRGQVQLSPALAAMLASAWRQPAALPASSTLVAGLTERERQTLALIAEGLSNKLIARHLGISDGTVKIHVKHLLSKLNLHSRLELAAWAHRSGIFASLVPSRGEVR